LAVADPSSTFGRCAIIHACNASAIGLALSWRIARRSRSIQILHLAFDVVKIAKELQRDRGDLALAAGVQFGQLASGLRQAPTLDDTFARTTS
jgi:hypothetical protein